MKYNGREIAMVVVRRLPRYYRYLGDLKNQGIERISSGELSKKMNVTASQIRQDLNCFGGFGQQGFGYNVAVLHEKIGEILGVKEEHNCIIAGAGNLGHALSNYHGLSKRGFNIVGIFDSDPAKIGSDINGLTVLDVKAMGDFISTHDVEIGVLAVPRDNTKEVADEALLMMGIDKMGLDMTDRRMITCMIQNFHGGPVGLETIAASIGEDANTIEDVYEP